MDNNSGLCFSHSSILFRILLLVLLTSAVFVAFRKSFLNDSDC